MAAVGIYCTLDDVQYKAGVKASATSKAEAYVTIYVGMAEAVINVACRRIFAVDATAFSALPTGTRKILSDAASNLAAIYVINFDLSGFTTRLEAEDMVNILRDAFLRDLAILKEKEHQTFLVTGA